MGISGGERNLNSFYYRVDDIMDQTILHLFLIREMKSVCIFADSRGKNFL